MKRIFGLLVVSAFFSLQANHLDEMIAAITASDIKPLSSCSSSNTFSVDELEVLKNLSETMVEKRKTDSWKNHLRPSVDVQKIWLFLGFYCCDNLSYNVIDDKLRKTLHSLPYSQWDAILSLKDYFGMAVEIGAAVVSAYCLVKLIKSLLRQADEYENSYNNAIQINTALDLMIAQAKKGSLAVPQS